MSKITAYGTLTTPQYDDVVPIGDIHDTTMAPSGTTKKITVAGLGGPAWYNVQGYGAKGNGTTDDTAAIQAAINGAGSGGTAFVPYTSAGFLCGALTIPPGVRLLFDTGAYLTAPSSLSASWIKATAAVHNGTSVENGTFIATAATVTGVTAVIDFSAVTSCPNLKIRGNRIVNAPVHGIFASESSYTSGRKWIDRNSVEQHGVAATGYGIFCDYIGNVDIAANYVTNSQGDDCIELGHSSSAYLGGLNACLRCRDNVVVISGGTGPAGIQFPFSHQAIISGNTVIGGTIQNDTNTANNVMIEDNLILAATPGAGYAGIRVYGAEPVIAGNKVFVTTGNGIATATTMAGAVISDNYIYSSAGTNTGSGIYDGGSGGSANVVKGNVIDGTNGGGFTYGLNISSAHTQVADNALTGGCFDGINGSGTAAGLVFHDNDLTVFNVPVAATPTGAVLRNNKGYNPAGTLTISVPASGTATAAQKVDATFYVTAAASGTTTVAISGGPTITVPASACVPVLVPAGQPLTPAYTSAPTWVVEGL